MVRPFRDSDTKSRVSWRFGEIKRRGEAFIYRSEGLEREKRFCKMGVYIKGESDLALFRFSLMYERGGGLFRSVRRGYRLRFGIGLAYRHLYTCLIHPWSSCNNEGASVNLRKKSNMTALARLFT